MLIRFYLLDGSYDLCEIVMHIPQSIFFFLISLCGWRLEWVLGQDLLQGILTVLLVLSLLKTYLGVLLRLH